jgi:adenylate kinase
MVAPQGAGKGTQSVRLAEHYGIEHISSGDLLREEVALGTALGRQVRAYLERGDLVPDDLVLEMMLRRLRTAGPSGFVLDGWPRTLHQALAADELLASQSGEPAGVGFQAVVNLDVPLEELHRRLAARAEEQGRNDDDVAVVEHRLALYERETKPLLEHYRSRGILLVVDGNQPPELVAKAVISSLDALVGAG